MSDNQQADPRDSGLYLMSGGMGAVLDQEKPSLRSILLGTGRGVVQSLKGLEYFFVGDGASAYVVLDSWHAYEMVMLERPVLRVSRFDFQQDLLLLCDADSHPDSPLVRWISMQAREYTKHLMQRMIQAPDGDGIRLWRAMNDVDLDLDSVADRLIEGYTAKKTD